MIYGFLCSSVPESPTVQRVSALGPHMSLSRVGLLLTRVVQLVPSHFRISAPRAQTFFASVPQTPASQNGPLLLCTIQVVPSHLRMVSRKTKSPSEIA